MSRAGNGDRRDLLLRLLHRPEGFATLSLDQWDLVVRQARSAGILARVCYLLDDLGILQQVPDQPRRHLTSVRTIARKHLRDVRWEVICVARVLETLDIPIILLKGAAYVMGALPAARGRLFGDIDFMVPKNRIEEVEHTLLNDEWFSALKDDYDQRYYRRWTHQIPPIQHDKRSTVLDIHHTIVQPTARTSVEAEPLAAASQALADDARLRILAPPDIVLHSAVHLFNEGEFDRGLRDLLDINDLLQHFGAEDGFWEKLIQRAEALGLTGPLFLALRYLQRLLDAPLPAVAKQAAARWQPPALKLKFFDALFLRALMPDHPSCDGPLTGLARWLLYARAHYLRMPLPLLLPHLIRKAFYRPSED